MTVEHRLLFGLSDIVALSIECSKCGIRLSMAPEKVQIDQLRQCHSCGSLWLANDEDTSAPRGGAYTVLLLALRRLAQAPKADALAVGFKLNLEFASPPK